MDSQAQGFFLGPQSRDTLRQVVDQYLKELQSNSPDSSETFAPPRGPEVYVVKLSSGVSSIPKRTGTTPGNGNCDLYKLDPLTGSLAAIAGQTKKVYNPYDSDFTNTNYFLIERTKGGAWICPNPTDSGKQPILVNLDEDLEEGGFANATTGQWTGLLWTRTGGSTIEVADPLNEGPCIARNWIWVLFKEESGRYELVSSTVEEIVFFKLKQRLLIGGQAIAKLFIWDQVAQTYNSSDDPADEVLVMDVSDSPGTFYGKVGYEGMARRRSDRPTTTYEIIWIEHRARIVLCKLKGPFNDGTALASVEDYFDGKDPQDPPTINVEDPSGLYKNGQPDDLLLAYYDPELDIYFNLSTKPGTGNSIFRFQLLADLKKGGNASAQYITLDDDGNLVIGNTLNIQDFMGTNAAPKGTYGYGTKMDDSDKPEVITLERTARRLEFKFTADKNVNDLYTIADVTLFFDGDYIAPNGTAVGSKQDGDPGYPYSMKVYDTRNAWAASKGMLGSAVWKDMPNPETGAIGFYEMDNVLVVNRPTKDPLTGRFAFGKDENDVPCQFRMGPDCCKQ